MAKGDKPLFNVTFRAKDAPKGSKGEQLCAIWKSQFPNQHNLSFPLGTQIRLPSGQVIVCDNNWFSCWVNKPKEDSVDPWADPPPGFEKRSSWDVNNGEVKQQKLLDDPAPVAEKPDDDIPF